jgi:hypothetical protein
VIHDTTCLAAVSIGRCSHSIKFTDGQGEDLYSHDAMFGFERFRCVRTLGRERRRQRQGFPYRSQSSARQQRMYSVLARPGKRVRQSSSCTSGSDVDVRQRRDALTTIFRAASSRSQSHRGPAARLLCGCPKQASNWVVIEVRKGMPKRRAKEVIFTFVVEWLCNGLCLARASRSRRVVNVAGPDEPMSVSSPWPTEGDVGSSLCLGVISMLERT